MVGQRVTCRLYRLLPQGNRILIWSENQAADLTSERLKKPILTEYEGCLMPGADGFGDFHLGRL